MTLRLTRAQLAELGIELEDETSAETSLVEGPFTSGFVVGLWTPVRSKSNFRRHQLRGQQWSQVREFEATVRSALTKARPESWPEDSLETGFSDRHGVVGVCYARAILDTSNLSKSIYDAAEGVLYANDAQVRAETSYVERGRSRPFLVCGFAAVDPQATITQLAEAQSRLSEAVLEVAKRFSTEAHRQLEQGAVTDGVVPGDGDGAEEE